jgi:hypothetical protein
LAGDTWISDRRSFFDLDERYAVLSKGGDPLEQLTAVVDFELLRAELATALPRSDRTKSGRPSVDAVLLLTRA